MREGVPGRIRSIGLVLAFAVAVATGVTGELPAAAAQLSHPAPIQERNAQTVTADVLPTAQIGTKSDGTDGVVWALKIVGDTVYAGGNFANARPAGASKGDLAEVTRSNLLSFSLTTGALTSFAPNVNGQVKALATSPDGSVLYVGGVFTKVNGESHSLIAAFDTSTGQLIESFAPQIIGTYVNAIAVTNSAVYVGGLFTAGNRTGRKNLMAFDTSGRLLGWAPKADDEVDAMVLTPKVDKLIVGGRFEKVNGKTHRGMAALSLTSGAPLAWAASKTIKNGRTSGKYRTRSGIYSLSTDGNLVYGTAWVYSSPTSVGNLEGAFAVNPDTGAIRWMDDCHGDLYSSYSDGTNLYLAGHPHDCESVGGWPQDSTKNTRYAMAVTTLVQGTLWRSPRTSWQYSNWNGKPAPAIIDWLPDFYPAPTSQGSGQGQSTWAVTGSGDYVVMGGEFSNVNTSAQQGLVRFARPAVSGAKAGPRFSGSTFTVWAPTVTSLSAGTARIAIPADLDRDNTRLSYAVYRSDLADPIYQTTLDSYPWFRPTLTFLDTGLTPGSTYTYQVLASDPDGNRALSSSVSVTITSDYSVPYAGDVLGDGALLYWQLGDGSVVGDLLGNDPGSAGTGVYAATPGIFGSAAKFSGSSSGRVASTVQQLSPDVFSAEIWFKTTSKKGGRLLGFGSAQAGTSALSDRHLYLSDSGKLSFGITQNHKHKVLTSKKTYRDGKWHQAVVTEGPGGTALYVDGTLVTSSTSMFKAEDYYGYWRLGGDTTRGWSGRGASDNFSGYLDEFSVYGSVLTAAQVRAHYLDAMSVGAAGAAVTAKASVPVSTAAATPDPGTAKETAPTAAATPAHGTPTAAVTPTASGDASTVAP